eukprot:TRINITY_DN6146_c0_g1_i3.p2 TRINITY_DN6146_c0_g1~~TRINITY_DN6146_c0_g1_i3.p2  ORF type:complete len:128 (-),score=27.55 TRINITY_DN6146_c0_g1_i3:68-451(-)
MCIRDSQRRVHGDIRVLMEGDKGVIGNEVGIVTNILLGRPRVSKVIHWVEVEGDVAMYQVLDTNSKVSYIIKQYRMFKDQGGPDFQKLALKEQKILALLSQYTPYICLLYTSPSPRDLSTSRMPSSA